MPNTPQTKQNGPSQGQRKRPSVKKAEEAKARKQAEPKPQKEKPPREKRTSQIQKTIQNIEPPEFDDVTLSMGKNQYTLTRRHFLLGALGAGAAAAIAAGAVLSDEETDSLGAISVDQAKVIELDDLEEVGRDDCFTMIGDYELPYGTLIWANGSEVATCLIPTNEASPLATVDILFLTTGNRYNLLEQAVAASEGFEIFDARASWKGAVWIEANAMEGTWRVMCSPMGDDIILAAPRILEEGDRSSEIPSIAAVGDYAFWQVIPASSNKDAKETPSNLKRARFIGGKENTVHTCTGRMGCPLCACEDAVVIAARNPESNSTFDLMRFDAASGKQTDIMTLPSGMVPNALGYGPNGFAFCFENIYNYGDGISNLGTYTPAASHKPGASYDNLEWFHFGRTPVTGPYWCTDRWFMVKSTAAVCGVDIESRTYCSLDIASGCADWGDFLICSGSGSIVATAMQIDQVTPAGETQHKTQVRVWEAI